MSFLTKKEQIRYVSSCKNHYQLKEEVLSKMKLKEKIDLKNILNSLYFVTKKFPSFRFKQDIKDLLFDRFINAYEGDDIITTEDELQSYHWECDGLVNQLVIPEYPLHESWGRVLNDIKYMHKFNTDNMKIVVATLKTLLFKHIEKPINECFTITFESGLEIVIDFQYEFEEVLTKIKTKHNIQHMYLDQFSNDWVHTFHARVIEIDTNIFGSITDIKYESLFSPSIRKAFFKLYYAPKLMR